jgi:hypothetical protein
MADSVSVTRAVVFELASVLGKLPVIYLFTLFWSGVIVGLTGQLIMFLAYMVTALVAYGMARPLLASITSPSTTPFLYGIPTYMSGNNEAQKELISVILGFPKSLVDSIIGGGDSFFKKYLLLSIPDIMIFPTAFLYGYGTATAENGAFDSRNIPILFLVLLSILVQSSVMEMNMLSIILNIGLGIMAGVMAGSLVQEDPALNPFILQNKQFRLIVSKA